MFASRNSQEAVNNLENEGGRTVHDIKRDVKEHARNIHKDVKDAAAHLRHDVEDVARQTGKHARELADVATGGINEMTQSLTAKIRENPVQASVVALLAGMVFGMFYRRR